MTQPTHVSGTIKPLEWACIGWSSGDGVEGENDDAWESDQIYESHGTYVIEWMGGSFFKLTHPCDSTQELPTLEAAKAAAQADYEARIAAQIDPDTEVRTVASGEAGGLLPCPICGSNMLPYTTGYEHIYHDTCPLESLWIDSDQVESWNRRALPAARAEARAEKAEAENERLRALMRRAHTLMLECGWQLAPASDLASGDGILEAVVAEVEDEFRAALERKEGGT